AGVDWVTAHAIRPAVANMSLGTEGFSPLDAAVGTSIASGIVYSVAAGNSAGDACAFSPADVAGALSVAATDDTDRRAGFSNFGSCVKLFAPGVAVSSDWNVTDTSTAVLSGTSMAAPLVGGLAALYLDRYPGLKPSEVADALVTYASHGRVLDPGSG